jgi:putative ABC transport system permease protein
MSTLSRLWNVLRPGRVEDDIDREMAFHLAERADQLRAEGLSEGDAIRRARLRFGNVAVQAERTRDVDVALWADAAHRNLRYAVRTLARAPGFTATVVLTLALGIGANAAVFSALDAVILRPLPFPEADRLMRIAQVQDRTSETAIAPVRLEDWNRRSTAFTAISGYLVEDASDTAGDLPERVRRAFVTPRFIETWGVPPAIGRPFTAGEHRFGGPAAVLVSDRYWARRFNRAPDVLSRSVRIGSSATPIVGVMPPSFLFPDREVDLWFPATVDAPFAQSRQATWFTGIGRLAPGVTLEQGRADLAAVQGRLAVEHPKTDAHVGVLIEPLKTSTINDVGRSLWLLFGAVTVVLLIACTNIAALLLSRATHRLHEISIRLSLGASRAAVAGQLLTEAAVLAAAGGALGLLVAAGAAAWLRSAAADLPRIDEMALDGRMLLYSAATTILVAVLCGVLPAIRMARPGASALPTDDRRTQVSGRQRLQWLLVGTQVALSVALLAGAGLLVRSAHALSQVNPGFERTHLLTFRISGTWDETADYGALIARIDRTIEELRALPGVDAVATTGWSLPGVPTNWEARLELVEARTEPERRVVAEARGVSPEYFETMSIPLLAGEACRRSQPDGTTTPWAGSQVVVNRAFATRHLAGWPSPIGLHIKQPEFSAAPGRIVGVVGDARERGLHRTAVPTVYWCTSAPNPNPHFLVRTRGEPIAFAQAIRLRLKELEPHRSVYDIATLEERIDEAFTETRLRTILLAFFATTALLLASIGLYGTLSYIVRLRSREIGLRLALGAARGRIVRQFLWQGLRIVAVACACGLAISGVLTRLLAGMLYGVTPADPVTLSGVVGLVLAIAVLASLLPALRAAFVDPVRVLRES